MVGTVRADRLLAITLLLQARGGMSAPQLARRLEVSVRTIYRDVEALSTAGIPVYVERGPTGGVRLLDGYRTDLTGLSPGEAEALFLLEIPGPLDQLGEASELAQARRKLLAALPQGRRPVAERLRRRVHVDTTGWDQSPVHAPHLATIADAVLSDRRIAMSYVRSDNREVERRVDPLGLVLKAGIWYLVGYAGRWDVVYRLSRVRSVEVLAAPCRRPPDFDLAGYWDRWLDDFESYRGGTKVRIRADQATAVDLPRQLGEAVRGRVLAAAAAAAAAGGDSAFELDLVFESVDEARTSLLGLGAAVEVLSPGELRAEMARAAAGVVRLYAGEAAAAPPRPAGDVRG
jgi:predicted DNA-binding transcriptional regulator YafY